MKKTTTTHAFSSPVPRPSFLLSRFAVCVLALFVSLLALSPRPASARPQASITSPSQLIDAVNSLRLSYGLAALPVHPILMQTAQGQADYMAATGVITHSRPGGMTYTQQLISLGFPLAGDLSAGGFRAENILSTYGPLNWEDVPEGWQDSQHMNTMLSGNFTHIGAGIAQSGDTYYYAVDTAAATGSGEQQEGASSILTASPGGSDGSNEFMVPVAVSTSNSDGSVYHKVQFGQSLWSIAIAYGTTIKNIQALNGMGEDLTVYEGQVLLVMTGATQAAQSGLVAPTSGATLIFLSTITPTYTPLPTQTIIPSAETAEEESQFPAPPSNSSRLLVILLIFAALVGAGVGVWLIRDPN